MQPYILLVLLLLAAPAPSRGRSTKLATFIARTQPMAKPYATELARAIIRESARRKLDACAMTAIAWIESDFIRWAHRAGDGSHGIWQLRASDSYVKAAWGRIKPTARGWWAIGHRGRLRALRDPVVSTYLAAYEVRQALRVCQRLWRCRRSSKLAQYARYNSGLKPPRVAYLRELRRRSAIVCSALK